MGFIQDAYEKIKAVWADIQGMAPPDKFLLLGVVAGALLSQTLSPKGEIAGYIERNWKHPDWVPESWSWWRMLLGVVFLLVVLIYLVLRGNDDEKPIRKVLGRILAADVMMTTGAGVTTAQQSTCEVIVDPTVLATRKHPAPNRILICSPSTDRRFELFWVPAKRVYRGTCDEHAFHDDIVRSMSTSPDASRVIVDFTGRRFVHVVIKGEDGTVLCGAIAICEGFEMQHDPVRDGFPFPRA